MTPKMGLRDAFAFFDGAKGRNQRWSNSARSEDGKTVVLAIYDFNITCDGDKVRIERQNGRAKVQASQQGTGPKPDLGA